MAKKEINTVPAGQNRTILDLHNTAKTLNKEIPFDVWRLFFDKKTSVELWGDQLSFQGQSSDFGTLEEFRKAIEWFATEFGGKVAWDKTKVEASPKKESQGEK